MNACGTSLADDFALCCSFSKGSDFLIPDVNVRQKDWCEIVTLPTKTAPPCHRGRSGLRPRLRCTIFNQTGRVTRTERLCRLSRFWKWASVTRCYKTGWKCIIYKVYWYKLDSCCHSEWILSHVDGMALMVGSSPGGPRQPEMYSAWLPDVLSLADLHIKFKKKRWNVVTN